ncbi:BTAD domain-containing putative transcriptional regulator [Kitasatospora sp. NPDC092948]|uniref:AfsR/SARP family transcriptional regulator n=1 Tax=Kitasatospora sp. NPDC092948 TaxID=3364088 RepID=UPI003801ECBD
MDATTTETTVQVLGPMAATTDGARVRLGGPRPRAVLAVLAAAGGAVVPEQDLIDAVWEDRLPARPRHALHTCVADLRRALEPHRPAGRESSVLRHEPGGYRLRLAPDALDARRFAALVERAGISARTHPAEALAAADLALSLWRGPAYADLAHLVFLDAERWRLTELRCAAREIRASALLTLDAHQLAVTECALLTTEAPLRESGWALRARTLYRSGRQAEAAAVLHTARRTLRDELGVHPGPELAHLTRRILIHDPTLSAELHGSAKQPA